MAYSRYSGRETFVNEAEGYQKEFLSQRDLKKIIQFKTAKIGYPSNEEIASLTVGTKTWGATDKLYNLANDAYGSPELWWIIAWFNKKPTAAHFKVGDTVYIPQPVQRLLEYFEG